MGAGIGIIGWIIIGGLAGWIASKIKGTDAQQGVGLNIVVGVVGALIGGFVLRLFGVDMHSAGVVLSFVSSLVGSVILLSIIKMVKK